MIPHFLLFFKYYFIVFYHLRILNNFFSLFLCILYIDYNRFSISIYLPPPPKKISLRIASPFPFFLLIKAKIKYLQIPFSNYSFHMFNDKTYEKIPVKIINLIAFTRKTLYTFISFPYTCKEFHIYFIY